MSSTSIQLNNKNIIEDSTRSRLEIFYNNTQETLDKGFNLAFKNLNDALINTINTAFSAFESEHERRLENNRENHEKTMSGLNSQYTTAQDFYKGNKSKEKAQSISIVENYERFKNNRKKTIIFFALKKYYLKKKNLKIKHNNILKEMASRKKYLIFNSWRNIANSFKKTKIKLINNNKFLEETKKIEQENGEELDKLKFILESLEKDIQKEINERKSLANLYDMSLKKGIEAFLRETNYIINFDSSRPQTPNEKSFIDAEENYNRYIQIEEEIKGKTK
jgi:hypothetical protein